MKPGCFCVHLFCVCTCVYVCVCVYVCIMCMCVHCDPLHKAYPNHSNLYLVDNTKTLACDLYIQVLLHSFHFISTSFPPPLVLLSSSFLPLFLCSIYIHPNQEIKALQCILHNHKLYSVIMVASPTPFKSKGTDHTYYHTR